MRKQKLDAEQVQKCIHIDNAYTQAIHLSAVKVTHAVEATLQ